MSKKSQSLLVSFSVHLVGIMIFFIVLISLLSMTHNIKYTINEFDQRTASILVERRLTSSADCLAYEARYITVDPNSGHILTGSRVYPNVIDVRKLNDYEHVNCMRKDMYDLREDVREGVWDAAKGHGAAQKYDLVPIDLSDGFHFMKTTSCDGLSGWVKTWCELKQSLGLSSDDIGNHIITSLLSRVDKYVIVAPKLYLYDNTPSNDVDINHSLYGCGPYTTIDGNKYSHYCGDILVLPSDVDDQTPPCEIGYIEVDGKCYYIEGREGYVRGDCKDSVYFDDYDDHPPNFYYGACVVEDNKSSPEGVYPIWAYTNHYVFYNTVAADTKETNYQIKVWNQKDTTCASESGSTTMIVPVMYYDKGKLKNGILVIDTCILEGEKHEGLTLPEIIYKPKFVKKG
ncbi:MAG: hypothetical protein J7K73_03765 [Nanoarchaeota archaeon]|nr:hypothetical protein [Nanoarchaeota archaeon]